MRYSGIIVGTKSTRPTARLIAEKFKAIYTEMSGLFVRRDSPCIADVKYIFRYGNSLAQIPEWFAADRLIFNSAKVIKLMSDKPTCRRILVDGGVNCPALHTKDDLLFERMGKVEMVPLIARPPHHSQGRSFYITKSYDEALQLLNRGYYLQDIIKKSIEYRLFMWGTHIFEANEKVKVRDDADEMIRNHYRGWRFEKRTLDSMPRDTRNACVKAAAAVRSDWCAIDVCEDRAGRPFILEMNSAPGLIERKVEKLRDRFFSEHPNFLLDNPDYPNDGPSSIINEEHYGR